MAQFRLARDLGCRGFPSVMSTPICPFIQRGIITVQEKGVEHEVVYIDLTNKPDWLLDISPLGKVPVLPVERDGLPAAHVFESSVLVRSYLRAAQQQMLQPN